MLYRAALFLAALLLISLPLATIAGREQAPINKAPSLDRTLRGS
jgi:hypothetical protein